MVQSQSIAQNIATIHERIENAAVRAGSNPDSIVLMGASKTVAPVQIEEAYAAGLRVLGENRIQEFSEKCLHLGRLKGARWHLIGHLQSNKRKGPPIALAGFSWAPKIV